MLFLNPLDMNPLACTHGGAKPRLSTCRELPSGGRNRSVSHLPRPPFAALVYRRNLRLMYVELHSCSAFSFLEGASLPEDLVSEAARLELPAIALLDRDGVNGSPRFHMAAKKAGIRAHVG